MALDPRTHAVRRDLADVRLAEQVFAPHYAEPVARVLLRDAVLREGPDAETAIVAELNAGERFDLLDSASGFAWGVATRQGLVGYLVAESIGPLTEEART